MATTSLRGGGRLVAGTLLVGALVLGACESSAANSPPPTPEVAAPATAEQIAARYREHVARVAIERADLVRRWKRERGAARETVLAGAREHLEQSVLALATDWLGTAWGLGAPQTSVPGPGQINCGTFVGTVLRDAGFVVDVRKLQRQPSQLIITSFVTGKQRMKRFSNASINDFLARVRSMGPGLFIIGLDFHVGLLHQTGDELRFIHASYVTQTVVNESAATAEPIVSSKYRVVGKILSDGNVRDWLDGNRIEVQGNW